eukprot:1199027-Amphidinium_carterae.1
MFEFAEVQSEHSLHSGQSGLQGVFGLGKQRPRAHSHRRERHAKTRNPRMHSTHRNPVQCDSTCCSRGFVT